MSKTYVIEVPMDHEPAGTRTWRDGSTRTVEYVDGRKVVTWFHPE